MTSLDTQNKLEKKVAEEKACSALAKDVVKWWNEAQAMSAVERKDEIVALRVKLFEESQLRQEAEESTQLALTCGLAAQDRCDAKDELIKKLTDQLNSYMTFCVCRHHTPLGETNPSKNKEEETEKKKKTFVPPPGGFRKTKKLTKAERRELQDRQRAAKLAVTPTYP